ncbi:bestrophin-like domain [Streptomyces lavendulae]
MWAAEASAVSQIARDAETFPPTTRAAMHGCVRDYAHAVVERQWSGSCGKGARTPP